MRQSIYQKFLLNLLLGIGGGVLGAVVLLGGYPFGPGSESQKFTQSPEFVFWLLLIVMVTSLLGFVAVPLWLSLKPFYGHFQRHRSEILLSNILILSFYFTPVLASPLLPSGSLAGLPNQAERTAIVTLLALLSLLPALNGVLLLRIASQSDFAKLAPRRPNEKQFPAATVETYLHYRELLRHYLTVLGLIIALITLATAALRNARLAAGTPEGQAPVVVVLAYGLVYTLLLALLYVPAHLALTDAGRKLANHILPRETLSSVTDEAEKRAKLEALLQIGSISAQALSPWLAILAPLLTAFLSSWLGFGP